MGNAPGWDRVFLDFSCTKLQQQTERICECLDRLSTEQIWFRDSDSENAVGNLVLHLCGNVRQWIVAGLGGKQDFRKRDLEFSERGGVSAEQLKARLRETVGEAVATLRGLGPEHLLEQKKIQKYELPALEAVYHVVEHFSGHAGQIIYATKRFKGADLGFYPHLKSPQPPKDQTP
jgi:uncharacterized damage-inducible protein DinB